MTRNVILIEDNPGDVELLRRAFDEHSVAHVMIVLEDGEQAITYLDALHDDPKVDLIILDLNIPRHDGIEVLRRYRSHPGLLHVPVAVFTSSASPTERQRVENIGVKTYLQKPMDLDAYLGLGATFQRLINNPDFAESN